MAAIDEFDAMFDILDDIMDETNDIDDMVGPDWNALKQEASEVPDKPAPAAPAAGAGLPPPVAALPPPVSSAPETPDYQSMKFGKLMALATKRGLADAEDAESKGEVIALLEADDAAKAPKTVAAALPPKIVAEIPERPHTPGGSELPPPPAAAPAPKAALPPPVSPRKRVGSDPPAVSPRAQEQGQCIVCGKTDSLSAFFMVEGGLRRHPACQLNCATCFRPILPGQKITVTHGVPHHSFCECKGHDKTTKTQSEAALPKVPVRPKVPPKAVSVGKVAAPKPPPKGSKPKAPPKPRSVTTLSPGPKPGAMPRRGSAPMPVDTSKAVLKDGEAMCTTCNKVEATENLVQLGKKLWKHPGCELKCHACFKPAVGGEKLKVRHGKVHHEECAEQEKSSRKFSASSLPSPEVRCSGSCHQLGPMRKMVKVTEGIFKHPECDLLCPWCEKVCSPTEPMKVNGKKLSLVHVDCRAAERKADDKARNTREEKRWLKLVRKEPGRPPLVKLAPSVDDEEVYKEYMRAKMKREEWENACIVRARKLRKEHTEAQGEWLIDGGWFDGFAS